MKKFTLMLAAIVMMLASAVNANAAKTKALKDGVAYTNTKNTYYDKITYTRTFNNTNWQPLYIPFEMSYEDWKDKFDVAYINSCQQGDSNGDGELDEWNCTYFVIKSGTLYPNHPYIIRAKKTGTKTITVTNTTLYAKEVNDVVCATASARYTFRGTYDPVNGLSTKKFYCMSGGTVCSVTNDETTLNPYRWYMFVEELGRQYKKDSDEAGIVQLKLVNMLGDEDEDEEFLDTDNTTDIEEAEADEAETDKSIYDINGRKMNVDFEALPAGIYFIDGKKVVKK